MYLTFVQESAKIEEDLNLTRDGGDMDKHLANLLSYLSGQHLSLMAMVEHPPLPPYPFEKDLAIVWMGQDLETLTWWKFISLWRKRLRLRIQEKRGWQCDQCGRGGGLDMHEAFLPGRWSRGGGSSFCSAKRT